MSDVKLIEYVNELFDDGISTSSGGILLFMKNCSAHRTRERERFGLFNNFIIKNILFFSIFLFPCEKTILHFVFLVDNLVMHTTFLRV